jgi:hypothetical protein
VEEFCRAAYGQATALDGSRASGSTGELLREDHEEGRPLACQGGGASCQLGIGHSPTIRVISTASRRAITVAGKYRQT